MSAVCQIQTHAPQQSSKPVDHPDRETVEVRQGTGPRATVTVTVLIVSLGAAAAVGALLLFFLYGGNT
jgi:hypothetical protein